MKEAIILAGGEGRRLKPHIRVPKPLVKLNSTTLIDFQISWLRKWGIERIIIPSKTKFKTKSKVIFVKEKERLGTGGAVKLALSKVEGKRVYVFNCDDIVFYDPNLLWKEAYLGGAILVTRPKSNFGKVVFDNAGNILRFEEKPILPWYVSCGHYVLKTEVIKNYFPDKGNLELNTFQRLADKKLLRGYEYSGLWLTINTKKDLDRAREFLKHES